MRKVILLVCVAMLVLALPVMSLAAEGSPGNSTAQVIFKEGKLKWDDATLGTMDLDFGTRDRPVAAVTYDAVSTNHKIIVNDPRTTQHGWTVTVKMGKFSAAGDTHNFEGTITLSEGAVSGTGGASTDGITVTQNLGITGSTAQVATATDKSTSGQFAITWANANQAKLMIADAETTGILVGPKYTATLTWMLTPSDL